MHPKFSIAVDRRRDFVTIVMSGLLLPEDVADFFAARRRAHKMLTCPPGRHVTLTDLRAMKILPRETVEAFAKLLTDPQSRARRLAFVVAPTLVRSQVMRALAGRDGRFFADMVEAETWLLDEVEADRKPVSHRRPSAHRAPLLRCVA